MLPSGLVVGELPSRRSRRAPLTSHVPDRSVCPGMQVAQSQTFETMASMLATFHLKPTKDEHGNEIIPETKSVDGLIRCADLFSNASRLI